MVKQSVVTAVKEYLRVLLDHSVPVEFAVLYGSYARTRESEDSDIDLVVVSEIADTKWQSWKKRLWELVVYADYRIEPIPVTLRQLEADDSSMIIEMARREGIVIYPDDERPPVKLAESGILAGSSSRPAP